MIASWLASHWYWFIGAAVITACVMQPALAWKFKWQLALAAAVALAVMQWMAAAGLRTELASRDLKVAQAERKAESEARQREIDARAAEQFHIQSMAELDALLTQEKEDALAVKDAVIADLRSGALRVRNDRKCPANGPAQAGASASTGDGAEGVYLPPAAQERVLRIGAEADDVARQLTACQAVITADRALQK